MSMTTLFRIELLDPPDEDHPDDPGEWLFHSTGYDSLKQAITTAARIFKSGNEVRIIQVDRRECWRVLIKYNAKRDKTWATCQPACSTPDEAQAERRMIHDRAQEAWPHTVVETCIARETTTHEIVVAGEDFAPFEGEA